ncbi:uncharacterized protein [Palaemon carinicauda]|uniref:uncharacterized protein isoform X8 n=1 Tax=Palaemon carinicauda TaxID=392227 RepID=UPI0035B6646C
MPGIGSFQLQIKGALQISGQRGNRQSMPGIGSFQPQVKGALQISGQRGNRQSMPGIGSLQPQVKGDPDDDMHFFLEARSGEIRSSREEI